MTIYFLTYLAIVFLILVIFWLPPQNSEKISLCGFTTLTISIFLIYFGQKVPPLHGKPPLLSKDYGPKQKIFYSIMKLSARFSNQNYMTFFCSLFLQWLSPYGDIFSDYISVRNKLVETSSLSTTSSCHQATSCRKTWPIFGSVRSNKIGSFPLDF